MMIRCTAAGTWLDMLGLIVVTILVLILTWVVTRWIGKRSQLSQSSRNVRIIERVPITRDKYLAIIEVAEHFYLISVTAQNIQMMTEIDDPDKLRKQSQSVNQSFGNVYKIIKEKGIRGLSDPQSYLDQNKNDAKEEQNSDDMADRNDNEKGDNK